MISDQKGTWLQALHLLVSFSSTLTPLVWEQRFPSAPLGDKEGLGAPLLAPMWDPLIKHHAVSPTSSALWEKAAQTLDDLYTQWPGLGLGYLGPGPQEGTRCSLRHRRDTGQNYVASFSLSCPQPGQSWGHKNYSAKVKTVTESWGPIPLQLCEPGQDLSMMQCLNFLLITYCKQTPGRKTTMVVSANMQTPVLNSQRWKDKPACENIAEDPLWPGPSRLTI